MDKKKSPVNFFTNTAKSILTLKFFIGILLIGIGVYAAITIIVIVFNIFTDLSSVPFLKIILRSSQKLVDVISTDTGTIAVSSEVLGYIVAFILLLIASRLSVKIISVGFKIIDKLEFKYMMQKIWKQWEETKKANQKNDTSFFRKR